MLAAAHAQSRDSRGVLAGSPVALLTMQPSPTGSPDGTTLAHRNGFGGAAPDEFQSTGLSTPDLRRILTAHGCPATARVDDFSTGRDEILIDSNGVLDVSGELWSVWQFSLRDGAVGTPGSRIAEQVAQGELGAAVFSYVLPGSGLPDELVGVVERSHSIEELGLAPGTEVNGLDTPMLLGLDQATLTASTGPTVEPGWTPLITPRAIYFTFSSASLTLVPPTWWAGTQPSGATVFFTQITPFSNSYPQPRLFLTYDDLGLTASEDVDGLAIDLNNQRVVFSTVGNLRDQFLFVDLTTDGGGTALPVTEPNGARVSTKIGKAQDDDVDAICTLDPRLESANLPSPGGDDFGYSCGEPKVGVLGPVPELSGSAFRRYEAGGLRFDSWMVGWPTATGAAPSLSALFFTTGDAFNPVLISLQVRNPADVIEGNPQAASLAIPSQLGLTGSRLTFRWFHLDWGTSRLSEAWPVQVYL